MENAEGILYCSSALRFMLHMSSNNIICYLALLRSIMFVRSLPTWLHWQWHILTPHQDVFAAASMTLHSQRL